MNDEVRNIREKIKPILDRHDVKRAAIFGSLIRGEATEKSDIDILVEIDRDISLFEFIGLKQELEDCLNRKVDLIEYDAIKPALKEKVLASQVAI
jgi:uncharacterized protein